MNIRTAGNVVYTEARIAGCGILTYLTSHKYYLISKDWLSVNCYEPARRTTLRAYARFS